MLKIFFLCLAWFNATQAKVTRKACCKKYKYCLRLSLRPAMKDCTKVLRECFCHRRTRIEVNCPKNRFSWQLVQIDEIQSACQGERILAKAIYILFVGWAVHNSIAWWEETLLSKDITLNLEKNYWFSIPCPRVQKDFRWDSIFAKRKGFWFGKDDFPFLR